jgi:hypothetical protein
VQRAPFWCSRAHFWCSVHRFGAIVHRFGTGIRDLEILEIEFLLRMFFPIRKHHTMNRCEYCGIEYARVSSLRNHRCKQRPLIEQQLQYDAQLQNLKTHYETRLQEIRKESESQLEMLKTYYESRLQDVRRESEVQTDALLVQLRDQKLLTQIYREQIFELAKRPHISTSTTSTSTNNAMQMNQTNQRTLNIINQLAPYDLDKQNIKKLLNDHFTPDIFFGGPDEIAKFTAQVILKDSETNKPKLVCTDLSRKNFRYLDPVQEQQLQVDPGFQKTHDLIRDPLLRANMHVYTEVLNINEQHRNQWKTNDDFISDRTGFSDKLVHFLA